MSQKWRNKSIIHYLISRGVGLEYQDNFYKCRSPFANDSNPSFTIYPTNSFYCWATGKWGSVIDLIRHYENCGFLQAVELSENLIDHDKDRDFPTSGETKKIINFDYQRYINYDEQSVADTFSYAKTRRISSGFLPGVYWRSVYSENGVRSLVRIPALMFLHQDINGKITGAKFRNIYDYDNCPRFTARGVLGFYVLKAVVSVPYKKGKIWLCESETSANSLWEFFKSNNQCDTVVSMGGVGNPPKTIPNSLLETKMEQIRLVIDYDGNEDLYQQRLAKYAHLGCKPIRMILPKGEDINSLYCKDEMWKIEHLLNN